MKRSIYLFALMAVLGLVAFGAAACGDDDDEGEEATATTAVDMAAEIPSVEITGVDYSFEAPESIAGGLTRIEFTNGSEMEDHQAQLLKLNDGVTLEDLTAAESEEEIFALVTAKGGPGTAAGQTNENVLDLEPGQYAIVCFIPSPSDGIPHVQKGMIAPLEVTEAPDEQPDVPDADVTIGLGNFTFDGVEPLTAGTVTLATINNGPQPHELAVFRLDEGLDVDGLVAILSTPPDPDAPPPEGPPPFAFVGQVAIMSLGGSGQTTIDMAAGTYAFLCFVTDPETEAPHFVIGMAAEVLVE